MRRLERDRRAMSGIPRGAILGRGSPPGRAPTSSGTARKPRQGFGEGGARRYSVLPCGLDEPHQQIEPAQQDARLNGQREQPRFPEHDQQQEPAARE